MLLFVFSFIATIAKLTFSIQDSTIRSYATTVTTFVFSFMWSQLAKKLVDQEDHKQEKLKTNSLILKLGFVKLFLFLFPLCRVAFLMRLSQRTCGTTAHEIWKGYHHGVKFHGMEHIDYDHHLFKEWMQVNELEKGGITRHVLEVMGHFGLANDHGLDDKICFMGCKPTICDVASNDKLYCVTTCYDELQSSLTSLFVSHVVFTAMFIVIGIVMVVWSVWSEMSRKSGPGRYTFLQFQEKCRDVAPYEYLSWGGSYVEDFLEVVLAFALIASFAIVCPALACIALVTHVIENRLLLWRTLNITCRPFPDVSQGIGAWNSILEIVVSVALLINGGLVVSMMRTPMERWNAKNKFCIFSIWTMSLMFFRIVLRALLPDTSSALLEAEKKNTLFLQKFRSWWRASKHSQGS